MSYCDYSIFSIWVPLKIGFSKFVNAEMPTFQTKKRYSSSARPEGPKIEAQATKAGVEFLWRWAASPLPTSKGVWGSAVSSPSRVRGSTPATKQFLLYFKSSGWLLLLYSWQ